MCRNKVHNANKNASPSGLSIVFSSYLLTTVAYFISFHIDIDECATNTHSCDVNAVCTNTAGSHNCTCKPGYAWDGKKCSGKLIMISSFSCVIVWGFMITSIFTFHGLQFVLCFCGLPALWLHVSPVFNNDNNNSIRPFCSSTVQAENL